MCTHPFIDDILEKLSDFLIELGLGLKMTCMWGFLQVSSGVLHNINRIVFIQGPEMMELHCH